MYVEKSIKQVIKVSQVELLEALGLFGPKYEEVEVVLFERDNFRGIEITLHHQEEVTK